MGSNPDSKQLGGGRVYFSLQFFQEETTILAEKAWWQEPEAIGHIASTFMKLTADEKYI